MKYSLIAASMASAQAGRLFNKFEPVDTQLIDQTIGTGFCQAYDQLDFFNLQPFDSVNRDKKTHTPSVVGGFTGNSAFAYKACQPQWDMKEGFVTNSNSKVDDFDLSTCEKLKGTAYWVEGGACKYTFDNSKFEGVEKDEADSDGDTNIGFKLTFTSNEKCNGEEHFQFTLESRCEKDTDAAGYGKFEVLKQDTCAASARYTGKEGCKLYSFQLQRYMDAIAPYIGFVFLALGIVMTFFGARFILYVFSTLCGILAACVVFALSYNLVLDEKTASQGGLIAVVIISFIIGLVGAYLSFKFAKNWAIAVIAAWGGIAICMPLTKVVGIHGSWAPYASAIFGAVVGFYLGKKFNVYVRSIGTSIIGAFLATRGLGSLIGNYPSESKLVSGDFSYDPVILGYAACMVTLAIVGSIVQIRMNRDRPADDEMFANEDEAKGLF
jgi:uncharacterized membrane protein YqgA involved in biofilm formation